MWAAGGGGDGWHRNCLSPQAWAGGYTLTHCSFMSVLVWRREGVIFAAKWLSPGVREHAPIIQPSLCVDSRHRKCPGCGISFGAGDVQHFYFT